MCQSVSRNMTKTVLGWVKHRVDVLEFLQPFKGQSCLLYIDDQHTGELQVGNDDKAYANLNVLEKGRARASSAAFVVCHTLTSLGYFIGLGKCTLWPSQSVVCLGLEVDSVAEVEEERTKFVALTDKIRSSKQVDIKTLQRFAGKCISFALAVPGARLFVKTAFSVALSYSTVFNSLVIWSPFTCAVRI